MVGSVPMGPVGGRKLLGSTSDFTQKLVMFQRNNFHIFSIFGFLGHRCSNGDLKSLGLSGFSDFRILRSQFSRKSIKSIDFDVCRSSRSKIGLTHW